MRKEYDLKALKVKRRGALPYQPHGPRTRRAEISRRAHAAFRLQESRSPKGAPQNPNKALLR